MINLNRQGGKSSMGCGCKTSERDRIKEERRNRYSYRSHKQSDDQDESYRHCGCLDCRHRRNRETYM